MIISCKLLLLSVLTGGLDDVNCYRTVERYDPQLDEWTEVASLKSPRGGVGVATLGKYLYVAGGNDGSTSLQTVERYNGMCKNVFFFNFTLLLVLISGMILILTNGLKLLQWPNEGQGWGLMHSMDTYMQLEGLTTPLHLIL